GYRDTHDALPEAPPPLDEAVPPPAHRNPPARTRLRLVFVPFETPPDTFGRFRIYCSRPLTIPNHDATLDDFTDHDLAPTTADDPTPPTSIRDAISPCPNLSTFYFLHWFWKGSNKSIASREELRTNVILRPGFNPSDLRNVNLPAIDKKLAEAASYSPQDDGSFIKAEGWKEISVPLRIPTRRRGPNGHLKSGHQIRVPGLNARKILTGIRKGFEQLDPKHFHHEPYTSKWIPPGAPKSKAQTLMDEIYTSPEMMQYHKDIQKLKISDKDCTLPRVCAAVMFGSDAMQLGPFSPQKAWMLYMWLGNFSKYERAKPNSGSCFDLAHIPSLPDSVKDEITKLNGRPPSGSLLTFLRRELMHAVLHELLDAEFLQAWQHGIVIKCADGIWRRVFPRIFTYAADYPERVLLATVRDKGTCPCPRCLVPMDRVHMMGSRSDMRMRSKGLRRDSVKRQKLIQTAQSLVFKQQKAVDNKEVEALLKPNSWVLTENAFSRRLLPLGFDFFKIFVVDLLHEIELGVWKSLLTHLLRIIHSCGGETVAEFNRRFRQVPTFCNSTIRKFSEDVASLKRLAARDLEDILQCCMPVFKGLMPESIDSQVQRLLFTLSYWHALAKLRQHTSKSLKKLSEVAIRLGNELRDFKKATDDMEIFETPREYTARQRKAAARTTNQRSTTKKPAQTGRKRCQLNLNTPKFHAVGHYVAIIAKYGTTDSFSTQTTELQHRKIKAQWFRTNMRDAVNQMTRIGDIGDALDNIQERLNKLEIGDPSVPKQPSDSDHAHSSLPYGIGQSSRAADAINVPLWVQRHSQEISVKFFMRQLKEHLLARALGVAAPTELGRLTLVNDRIYTHATLRLNYTSYDVRRQHDIVNPNTPCRYILLPNDTTDSPSTHPFLYARVLGIYHAMARCSNGPPKRMDFLWVRWLDYDKEQPGGWESGRLDRLYYAHHRNDAELLDAFGFVDPRDVIRACHLIPDFRSGRAKDSVSMVCDDEEGDWAYHSVNRFVDRDMVMRYLGGGVGHFNQHAPMEDQATSYELDSVEPNEPDEDEDIVRTEDVMNGGDAYSPSDDQDGSEDDEDDSSGGSEDDGDTDDEDFIEDLYEL
ncbi:hypothetical protein FRC09_010842, partial [Ceratobasidium sp. 395]